jgi:uncharacterized protein (DUF2062 family)
MFWSKNKFWFSQSVPRCILGSPPPSKKGGSRHIKFIIKQWIHRLIHLNESPYRIAMGCACGIFCSALPIFGQTFIGMITARLLSASVIASLPWTWISNPLTIVPMWYGGYKLGIWITPGNRKSLSYIEIQALMHNFNHMDWTEGLSLIYIEFWDALLPLWLGTVVIGLTMAAPSFFLIYYITEEILRRRMRRRQFNNEI